MRSSGNYLACDLGAESGRVIVGTIEGEKVSLQEIHRFANVPKRDHGSLQWNIPNLILELKEGLRKAAATGLVFESISTDSWGVDYILFDAEGAIMEPVFHYRDPRTQSAVEAVWEKVEWPAIFQETGIQFMSINTLFQLAAEDPERLKRAAFLLGVGDAFNYFLSGAPKIEVSMASTFQLYNPHTGRWSEKLIEALGLPHGIFPEIVPSGARLGKLRPDLASELGLPEIEVIATCSHDTGAAVAGVPASLESWAYLSSGTWSLMGVELDRPVINDKTRELNFTNEIGFGNSVRLLKNISGLWLIQECRRIWEEKGDEFDYGTLTRLAEESQAFRSLIDPSSHEFLAPESMPGQIVDYCDRTSQPVPETYGQFARCALESLALLYRRTFEQIQEIIGRRVECLHIVGGGSNNDLLNQFTANALQIPVLAGPAEATAAGNILIQAIALGHLPSLAAARQMIRNSYPLRRFEPKDPEVWSAAYTRFLDFASPAAPLDDSETVQAPG
jgi:rhamnulokinase